MFVFICVFVCVRYPGIYWVHNCSWFNQPLPRAAFFLFSSSCVLFFASLDIALCLKCLKQHIHFCFFHRLLVLRNTTNNRRTSTFF
jgi:hypothetical protein